MTHLPAYNPGNFLMKTMNPTNSGLYCNIVKHVYIITYVLILLLGSLKLGPQSP